MCLKGLVQSHDFFLIITFCNSALDLPYFLGESNKTLHTERIYVVVVHPVIGFIEWQKMCLKDLIEGHEFFLILELHDCGELSQFYWHTCLFYMAKVQL